MRRRLQSYTGKRGVDVTMRHGTDRGVSNIAARLVTITLFSLTLAACATPQSQWTQEDQADYEKRKAITDGGKLLHDEVPSRTAMESAKALGLRTDGYYWFNETGTIDQSEIVRFGKRRNPDTNYIRFCDDGSVVDVLVAGLASDIKSWLTCEPVNPIYSHGVIKVQGKEISYRLYMTSGTIDYWGTVLDSNSSDSGDLELHFRSNVRSARTYGKTQRKSYQFQPF